MRKSSFAPVTDARTRLLVLGSLPGEMSLAAQRYYANPRNQLWRLIGAVIDVDLVPLSYEERLATLLRHRVGLWDVVGSALRPGSLDGAIREHEANPLAELAAGLPDLRAVAFNGGTSARLGMKELGTDPPFALVSLPSSSPAFTLAFESKLERWRTLRAFLA
ncbi:DNA-deoxyinosine glycosylase [Sphingosinicella sp. LY1275]|uniref:DNA-deoxyinosine glycosylase n=1 Tax=Sphingosinicella sp. LY1275 TaxID=3095379 RepID=UPI002ADEDAB1|nr:DNA-deoxyinosine glycosylase [Sphingosinicella sp. LY1275]MEA1016020.1 DNA-deoxyinosine glycosylase [Sphingosinicella sp. LY1275]